MSLGELPKLAVSLNGIMSATDTGTATAQVALGAKAIAEMAQKIAGIKQFADKAGQYFDKISEQASSLFTKAGEISGSGDNFLKQAGEILTQNGEMTGAEIGDVVQDDNSAINNMDAISAEGGNAGSSEKGGSIQIGLNGNSGDNSVPLAPAPTTNSGASPETSTQSKGNPTSTKGFGGLTTRVHNEGTAGAYFDRRREKLDQEAQAENNLKAEKGDKEAQEKVKSQTGVKSQQPDEIVNKEKVVKKNPKINDINKEIEKLQNENKGEKDKKEQFKPLVEQDAANFAQMKKQIKSLDEKMNKNKEGFANVKKEAKEKMEKGNAKCVEQGALSASATALATTAQRLNQTAAPLFSVPLMTAVAKGLAVGAFASNKGANAIDQQANKAGQDAANNYQTAVNNMNNGLSQFVAPQNGLATQKMTLAKNLLTLNNARKEQIQSVQEGEQNISQNNTRITQLQNQQKAFGLQTTMTDTSNIV